MDERTKKKDEKKGQKGTKRSKRKLGRQSINIPSPLLYLDSSAWVKGVLCTNSAFFSPHLEHLHQNGQSMETLPNITTIHS